MTRRSDIIVAVALTVLLVAPSLADTPRRERAATQGASVSAPAGEAAQRLAAKAQDAAGPSGGDNLARLEEMLSGKPGLFQALASTDASDVLRALKPSTAPRASSPDLGAVLDLLGGDSEAAARRLDAPAPPLDAALEKWARVAGRDDAGEIAAASDAARALPPPLTASFATLVDALAEAESLRQQAFAGLAPEDAQWLLEHEAGTDPGRERALISKVDLGALVRGTTLLWAATQREIPRLSEAALDLPARPALPGAAPADPAQGFDILDRELRLLSKPSPGCLALVDALDAPPLRVALADLVGAAGGASSQEALQAADRLPADLQAALARIVHAYTFALRESARSGLGMASDPACPDGGPALGALAITRAMQSSGPTIEKWGLALDHAPAIDQVGDVRAFASAQQGMASRQDGSASGAVALAAWEAGFVLAAPTKRAIRGDDLAPAVLDLYDAMGIQITPAERAGLAQDASRVPPDVQRAAARILFAEAQAVRAMEASEAAQRDTTWIVRHAPRAQAILASSSTTWSDVAWLRQYYERLDAAREVERVRFQAAYDLAWSIDESVSQLADAAAPPRFSTQAAQWSAVPVAGWLGRLLPWTTASAQSLPKTPDLPPEIRYPVPFPLSPANDVVFADSQGLVVIGGARSTTYGDQANWRNPGRQVLTLDLGGSDTYLNAAGGASTESAVLPVPVAVSIDIGGNDRYDSLVPNATQGAALASGGSFPGAIGVLVDYQGDDTYRGPGLSQGAAMSDALQGFAMGLLLDGRGNDTYLAKAHEPLARAPATQESVGKNPVGIDADDPDVEAVQADPWSVLNSTPASQPLLSDVSGWQGYSVAWQGLQAAPPSFLTVSAGVLVDAHGRDRFSSPLGQGAGLVRDPRVSPAFFAGATQVAPPIPGVGARPQSFGALVSLGGDDQYAGCAQTCQGAGAGGLGLFFDENGTDTYSNAKSVPFEKASGTRGNDRDWLDGRIGIGFDVSDVDKDRDGIPGYLEFVLGSSDAAPESPAPAALRDFDGDGVPDLVENATRTDWRDRDDHPVGAGSQPPSSQPAPVPSGSDKIIDLGLSSELSQAVAGVPVRLGIPASDDPFPRLFALGGTTQTRYQQDYALTIDLLGDDVYDNNAGANVPLFPDDVLDSAQAPLLGILREAADGTLSGVSSYESAKSTARAPAALPFGGLPGVALDVSGNDKYSSRRAGLVAAQGAGSYAGGLGILIDAGGDDKYASQGRSQGAAWAGAAGLTATPDGGYPGAVGVLLDAGGADVFTSPGSSQGFAQGEGALALLVASGDQRGSDAYYAPSQGYAVSPDAVAVFADVDGGEDVYQNKAGDVLLQGLHEGAQSLAGTSSSGVFVDLGGFDLYFTRNTTTGNLSDERNNRLRAPSYEPDSREAQADVLDVFLDAEANAQNRDADSWPDVVEALAGTNASDPDAQPAPTRECGADPGGCTRDANGFVLHLPNLGIALGSGADTRYETDYSLVVDLGGRNTYLGNVGGGYASTALVVALNATPLLPEMEAQNVFLSPHGQVPARNTQVQASSAALVPRQGAGALGIGMVVVSGGAAEFHAQGLAQGAGRVGIGIVHLNGTSNVTFEADRLAQGAAEQTGIGVLWSAGKRSNDSYHARAKAQGAASNANPLLNPLSAVAILYDAGGKDAYALDAGQGQAWAQDGVAALLDEGFSDDAYAMGGAWGQASASSALPTGPRAATAFALLEDEGGNDTYAAREGPVRQPLFAQGAAWNAHALLLDLNGNDRYDIAAPEGSSQAFARAGSPTQNASTVGILSDEDGRDVYRATGALVQGALEGVGIQSPALATLLDWQGDDAYFAGGKSQGYASDFTHGPGLLLDMGGWDRYQNAASTTPTLVPAACHDSAPNADLPISGPLSDIPAYDASTATPPDSKYRNNAAWVSSAGSGVGADLPASDALECALHVAMVAGLPAPATYALSLETGPGCATRPLRNDACLRAAPTSTGDARAIERAELYFEPIATTEGFSYGPVYLADGVVSPDGSVRFRFNSTIMADGHARLIARIALRTPWADDATTDASAPRFTVAAAEALLHAPVDNAPTLRAGSATPWIVNPHLGAVTVPILAGRDLPRAPCATRDPACPPLATQGLAVSDPFAAAVQGTPAQYADPEPQATGWHGSALLPTLRATGQGGLRLSWPAVEGADRYRVFQAVNDTTPAAKDFQLVGWTPTPWTTFVDGPLADGETYWYYVTAVRDETSESDFVPVESVHPATFAAIPHALFDPDAPGVPVVRAEAGDNWTRLAWRPAPGAASYTVCRQFPAPNPPALTCYQGLTAASFVDWNVTNNRTVQYQVRAIAADATAGADSDPLLVTPNPGGFVDATIRETGERLLDGHYVAGGTRFDVDWPFPMPAGEFTLDATIRDGAGFTAKAAIPFVVDGAPPASSVDLGPWVNAAQQFSASDSGTGFLVNWTAIDEGAGPHEVDVAIVNDSGVHPWLFHQPAAGSALWANTTNGGRVAFATRSTDLVGNAEDWRVVADVGVDFSLPVIEDVEVPATAKPGDVIRFRVRAHDDVSGVHEALAALGTLVAEPLLLEDSGWFEGRLTVPSDSFDGAVTISVADGAGNVAVDRSREVVIDATPPTFERLAIEHAFAGEAGSGRPGDAALVRIVALDDHVVASVSLDTSNVSLTPKVDLAKDALSGEFQKRIAFDRPDLRNGEYALPLVAVDGSGNVNATTLLVTIDDTPLSLANVSVVEVGPTWARLTWKTNLSATTSAQWGLDPSALRSGDEPRVFTTDHDYVITGLSPSQRYSARVVSHTLSGVEAQSDVVGFETLPSIPVLFTGIQGTPHWSSTVRVAWSTNATSANATQYSLALVSATGQRSPIAEVESAQETSAVEFDTKIVPDGAYRLEIVATNGANVTRAQVPKVVIDNTPPSAAILSPAAGGRTRGPDVVVQGIVTDASTSNLTAVVEAENLTVEVPVAHGVFRALLPPLPDGARLLVVRVRDQAGNEAVVRASFVVDGTPPAVQSASLAYDDGRGACAGSCAVRVRVEAEDASGIVSATVLPAGGALLAAELARGADGAFEAELPVEGRGQGEVPVVVRLVDRLGNARATRVAAIHIDDRPPTLERLAARPSTPTSLVLSYVADEPVSVAVAASAPEDPDAHAQTTSSLRPRDTFAIHGLRPSRAYDVTVTFQDAAGNTRVERVGATTPKDVKSPGVVENLTVADPHDGSVEVRWAPAKDDVEVAGYEVYRRVAGEPRFALVATANGTSFVDAARLNGAQREYSIVALDWSGNKGQASPAAGITLVVPPRLAHGQVSPAEGRAGDRFVYSVEVTAYGNESPGTILVLVDGVPHAMTLRSKDCVGTCVYEAGVVLGATRFESGDHTFAFVASSARATARHPAGADTVPGPIVVVASESGVSKVPAPPVALVVACCAVAAVALLRRRDRP